MLLVRFHAILSIFAHDHFQYYLFWLMMLLVRFRANLRLQLFSRARSCSLICCCSWEHSFLNFWGRSHPILFILPNDATGAISRISETATFFSRVLSLLNLPLLLRALHFELSRATDSNIIYLAWWCYWLNFAKFCDCNFFHAPVHFR